MSLSGFYAHFGFEECLMFAARAMERAGLDEGDLRRYQRTALDDLVKPFDEEALAEMHDYWKYNYQRLMERGRDYNPRLPAKPRVDVRIEFTSKRNFKAEWTPTDGDWYGIDMDRSDFVHFHRTESRGAGFGGRPSNELFFIRQVQECWLDHEDSEDYPTSAANTLILAACADVVKRLKHRLSFQFEVRMTSDIFTEWEDLNDRDWSREPLYRLLKWEIDDPEKRQRQRELTQLENMEGEMGFSETALLDAKAALDARPAKNGQEPSPHNYAERIAKELKKAGLPATKGKVETALALIDKHRINAKVVPFQPRKK